MEWIPKKFPIKDQIKISFLPMKQLIKSYDDLYIKTKKQRRFLYD